jgi:hypothetical protein
MSMQKITAFLAECPDGASTYQIARHIGVTEGSVDGSISRLLAKQDIEAVNLYKRRADAIWRLIPRTEPRRSVFRAKEILAAMQRVGREQLMGCVAEVA